MASLLDSPTTQLSTHDASRVEAHANSPQTRRPPLPPLTAAIYVLLLAAAYFLAGKLGLLAAIPPGYATAIWPASGIALGALLLLGPRYWPGVWLGSFAVNLATSYDGASIDTMIGSAQVAALIAAGAAVQAVIGARLIYRYTGGSLLLARERDVFGFYALGGPVAHLVGATFGTAILLIAGAIPSSALLENWWTWWVGDTVGALIFAPLIVMWCGNRADWASRRAIVTVPLVTMFIAAVAVFVYASSSEWRDLRQRFAEDTGHLGNAIAKRVDADIELLHALNAHLIANERSDDEALQRFTDAIVAPRNEVISLRWAPRTAAHEQRELFDAALRERRVIASAPLKIETAGKQTGDGLMLVLPVFGMADAHDALLGFAVATLDAAQLADNALRDKPLADRLRLSIEDISATNRATVHIRQPRFDSTGGLRNSSTANLSRLDFGHSMTIAAANRSWSLTFQPTLEYLSERKASTAWLALAGGLMFSALIGAGALLITGRGLSVETLVSQRTQELAQINETLAEEICDHLNTEHALDKERESLKTVLNNLYEGILAFDSNGQLRIANGAALRMYRQITGLERAHLNDAPNFDVYAADGATLIASDDLPQAHALRGQTVRDFEIVAQAAGRAPMICSVNAQPLFTSDGRQHGAIVVVRDITDTRQIERMKSEFVATVSHELRTPITSIRGSLGLIAGGASGRLNDKTKHLVEIALRNSDRLAHLINDLLDIEKMESGKMRFELQRYSLAELIHQAVEANSGYAQALHVKLVVVRPLPSAFVNVDSHRLLQVMANLLSNAAKFSPQGANVEISAVTVGHSVRVQVRDRGPGIAEEFRGRLFQKFSQADGSDARAKSGTGLGLAICKAIVEQMGGAIGYDTEIGVGSTFYFDLPIFNPPVAATSESDSREPQLAPR